MELRRYAAIIWRWSWLLVLGTVLAAVAAFLYSRGKTPIYQSRAAVYINQGQAITGPSYGDVLANQQLCKTYAEMIPAKAVQIKAADNLGIALSAKNPTFVTASCRPDTTIVDIVGSSTNPINAGRFANEVGKVFADQIRQSQLGPLANFEDKLRQDIKSQQTLVDERLQEVQRLQGGAQPGQSEDQRRLSLLDKQQELERERVELNSRQRTLQEFQLQVARTLNSVSIYDEAATPGAKVSPRTRLNTIFGGMLGLAIAIGVIVVAEYLDDTVKTADDVARAVGAATLGAISRFAAPVGLRGRGKRGITPRLLTSMSNTSTVAEAYRMVRTNLEFARGGRPNHTMLVTSALPGEGKSTTTANLALVFAQTGRRVILVDADLRRPSQHRLFDLPNTTGLSTLFVMEEPVVDGFLRMTPLDNLMVLPSGPLPPNPAELLSSARMARIIELLKDQAEVVLFDSPPLLGVADASSLASRLDGVVLVIDSGRTRAGVLTHAIEVLGRAQATLWGVVLNKLRSRRGEGYYYYYNYRYYGSADPARDPGLMGGGG